MRTASRIVLPLLFLAPLAAAPAVAQRVPGAAPVNARNERQQYSASVLREYTDLLEEWNQSLQSGDARAAARLYSEQALVVFGDGPALKGRQAVERWIADSAPVLGSLRTGLGDFVASGSLAHATGSFTFERREADGSVRVHTGTYVTVLADEGGHWRVRSQVFHVEPPAAGE